MLCFAPLIMVGALLSLNTPDHRVERQDGAVIDLQTCKTGLGAHVTAASSGLYALGGHYGFTFQPKPDWTFTVQPRAGFSYVDHAVRDVFGVEAVPMRLQFETGLMGIISYDRFHGAISYVHFSNAGLRPPNTGIDQILLLTGVSF